jgi:ABC-type polysaccharide/polyol phosphate transport system ATPase subunit
MEAVRRAADRVIWMQSGKVRQDGPTEEVLSAYERSGETPEGI